MAQDLPQGGPEDEAREEEIVDKLVRDQEADDGQDNGMSSEERRQLEDLGYRHLEEVPHSSGGETEQTPGVLFDD